MRLVQGICQKHGITGVFFNCSMSGSNFYSGWDQEGEEVGIEHDLKTGEVTCGSEVLGVIPNNIFEVELAEEGFQEI